MSNPRTPPQQILLIRHAEKPPPDAGPPFGVNEDGIQHEHSLIARGWQRAGALVPFFCTPPERGIRRPTVLYSPPKAGQDGDHGRPYETISPLAAALGLSISTAFVLDREEELAADVLRRTGVVLIAWEHKRIKMIANAILGNATEAPQTWPDERFDVVWVFDLQAWSGGYRFRQVPQLLLDGDLPGVIPLG